MGVLIGMGSLSVGGMIVESICRKSGQEETAQMIGIVKTTMLISTVVVCVLKAFNEVRKLGM